MSYTKAEKEHLVKEFQKRDKTVEAFLQEKGISRATLYKWLKANVGDETTTTLIDITKIKHDNEPSLEIIANDVIIKLKDNYDEVLLFKVLKSLKKI